MTSLIVNANGERFEAVPQGAVLTADGDAYNPPEALARDEFRIVEKALGMNKRTGQAERNCYRAGRPNPAMAALLNGMKSRGYVNLYIESSGLSKKDRLTIAEDVREGRFPSRGKLIAVVTRKGLACFVESVRQAKAQMEASR